MLAYCFAALSKSVDSYADETNHPQTQRRAPAILKEASAIVADSPEDDPPMSDVIDAALTHLLETRLCT